MVDSKKAIAVLGAVTFVAGLYWAFASRTQSHPTLEPSDLAEKFSWNDGEMWFNYLQQFPKAKSQMETLGVTHGDEITLLTEAEVDQLAGVLPAVKARGLKAPVHSRLTCT